MTVSAEIGHEPRMGNSTGCFRPPIVPQRVADAAEVLEHSLRRHEVSPTVEDERVVEIPVTPVMTAYILRFQIIGVVCAVSGVAGVRCVVQVMRVEDRDIVQVNGVRKGRRDLGFFRLEAVVRPVRKRGQRTKDIVRRGTCPVGVAVAIRTELDSIKGLKHSREG